jgi:hypothetical protein
VTKEPKPRGWQYTERAASRARAKRKNRKRRLDKIKMWWGCADCGYREDPRALQFDHRPGTVKTMNIGSVCGSMAWDAILAEIAKCDIVCANCHMIRTDERRTEAPLNPRNFERGRPGQPAGKPRGERAGKTKIDLVTEALLADPRLTIAQLCEIVGCSPNTVKVARRRMGVQRPWGRATA